MSEETSYHNLSFNDDVIYEKCKKLAEVATTNPQILLELETMKQLYDMYWPELPGGDVVQQRLKRIQEMVDRNQNLNLVEHFFDLFMKDKNNFVDAILKHYKDVKVSYTTMIAEVNEKVTTKNMFNYLIDVNPMKAYNNKLLYAQMAEAEKWNSKYFPTGKPVRKDDKVAYKKKNDTIARIRKTFSESTLNDLLPKFVHFYQEGRKTNEFKDISVGTAVLHTSSVGEDVKPAADPTPTPASTPAADPTPAPESTPAAAPWLAPESTPAADPTPAPESTPATDPTPAPESTPAADPTPAPESTPATDPTPAPEFTPAADPTPAPESTPATDPTHAPESTPEAQPGIFQSLMPYFFGPSEPAHKPLESAPEEDDPHPGGEGSSETDKHPEPSATLPSKDEETSDPSTETDKPPVTPTKKPKDSESGKEEHDEYSKYFSSSHEPATPSASEHGDISHGDNWIPKLMGEMKNLSESDEYSVTKTENIRIINKVWSEFSSGEKPTSNWNFSPEKSQGYLRNHNKWETVCKDQEIIDAQNEETYENTLRELKEAYESSAVTFKRLDEPSYDRSSDRAVSEFARKNSELAKHALETFEQDHEKIIRSVFTDYISTEADRMSRHFRAMSVLISIMEKITSPDDPDLKKILNDLVNFNIRDESVHSSDVVAETFCIPNEDQNDGPDNLSFIMAKTSSYIDNKVITSELVEPILCNLPALMKELIGIVGHGNDLTSVLEHVQSDELVQLAKGVKKSSSDLANSTNFFIAKLHLGHLQACFHKIFALIRTMKFVLPKLPEALKLARDDNFADIQYQTCVRERGSDETGTLTLALLINNVSGGILYSSYEPLKMQKIQTLYDRNAHGSERRVDDPYKDKWTGRFKCFDSSISSELFHSYVEDLDQTTQTKEDGPQVDTKNITKVKDTLCKELTNVNAVALSNRVIGSDKCGLRVLLYFTNMEDVPHLYTFLVNREDTKKVYFFMVFVENVLEDELTSDIILDAILRESPFESHEEYDGSLLESVQQYI
jgi:hypothetical protein